MNSSLFGPLSRRYREILTCYLLPQICTGHPTRSFHLSSTSPLKTGQTFGQFLYMRLATDEDFPGDDPIASSASSARTEHGFRQAAIDLSSNCSVEYTSRGRSGCIK